MSITKKRIAVIGAGFTGLTAAYELAKAGAIVTVYEKSEHIGGLAGGFTVNGTSLEQAYHHLFSTDLDILSLITELGLSAHLDWHPSTVAMVTHATKGIKVFPFNGVFDLLSFPIIPFIDRFRGGIATFFLQKYTNWKKLVPTTALSWMNRWAGKRFTQAVWGPLLKAKFSHLADTISMAWLWARIHIRANSRPNIFAKELLAYPDGGFVKIAEALQKKIIEAREENSVLTGVTIEKIDVSQPFPTITVNGQTHEFDEVIATIPEGVLGKLTDYDFHKNRLPITYLGAVVLAFTSPQSLSRFYWHSITDKNAPFTVFLQHTNLINKREYGNEEVYYIGAYVPQDSEYLSSLSKVETEQRWFEYLHNVFPQFDKTLITKTWLFKFPFAQHVVDTQYEQRIPAYRTDLTHLYLANFTQIFPEDRGTNYAVREGKKLAEMVLADLSQEL